MPLRHAFQITVENFSSAFKLLLYRLVVSILSFSLVYVILELALGVIIESAELGKIFSLVGDFFKAVAGGDSVRLSTFQGEFTSALSDFLLLVGENGGAIAGAIVGVSLIYLLSRFLNGLSHFAAACIMNDKMSSFIRTPISEALFRNMGKAALYEVIYVPASFVYDALSLLTCWFIFFYLPSLFPTWGLLSVLIALSLTVMVYLCLQSLKLTFVSSWIPSILAGGKSVGKGLTCSLRNKENFLNRFVSFLVAGYLIVVFNAMFGLFTLGSGAFITVPLSYLFLLAIQFVHYYGAEGKKYYVSGDTIIGCVPDCHDCSRLEEMNKKINASAEEATQDGQETP